MAFSNPQERFILLIEQFRVSLISGLSIDSTIKKFSGEFSFLSGVQAKIGTGQQLSDALQNQVNEEHGKIKNFLQALGAGDFAAQKLDELRDSLLKEKSESFENISSSMTSKLGWLSFFAIIPLGVYLMANLAEIFNAAELGTIAVNDSVKILSMMVCAIIFMAVLFMKRVKND